MSDDNKCVLKEEEGEVEEEDCPCSQARLHFIDKSCYKCGDSTEFYNINNGVCEKKENCLNKIIYETKECVGHCPSETCELGDFCYINFGEGNENNIEHDDSNKLFNICKCKNNFKKYKVPEVIGGKEQYKCVEICPTKYYNSDIGECVENCGTNKTFENIKVDNEVKEYRCSSKCKAEEYEKNNNCLTGCGDDYQYERIDGSLECIDECNEKDYYYHESERKCLNDCENKILYTKSDDKIKKTCIINSESSTSDYFEYDGKYFEDCSYTKNIYNKITYKIDDEEGGTKKCVEDCLFEAETPFLDDLQCKSQCEKNYYNKICLDNCDTSDHKHDYNMNFNIINNNNIDISEDTIQITEPNILSITTIKESIFPKEKECLEKCPFGTYIDKEEHKCYISSCNKGKFINSNLECQTCNKAQGYMFSENIILKIVKNENGGSRIRRLEDPIFYYYNITRKYCLSSCPKSSPYYNYNENECFKTNCKERNKYSTLDNPYVCYNSCHLIGNDYNSEKDNICYNTPVTCDNYFYYNGNNVAQCALRSECIEKKFKYLKGKECTNECGQNYYKIEFILNNNGDIQDLGACFLDVKDCINEGYIFYNNTHKICSKNCDFYKTSLENPMKNEDGDTCFSSCPKNYPYKDDYNKLCLMNCKDTQYSDGTYCLNSCQESESKKFNLEGTKECLQENCKKDNKYYYKVEENDNEYNNICYYSCPEKYPFIKDEDVVNGPKICKEKCEDEKPYYYEDKKICRKDCDILYNSTNKTCVYQCELGQKVINKSYCIDECPFDKPYILKEKLSSKNSLMVEKCVSDCTESYPYISKSTNYCLKQCPISEIYSYNNFCYEKCPNGTFADEIDKKCYDDKCPIDFKYYIKDENDVYKCLKSCPPDKFYLLDGKECLDECPLEYNYTSRNNICLKNCSSFYGEFFEKNEKNRFNCLSSCGEKKVIVDTKECVSDCPSNYYESPNGKCYSLCKDDPDYPFSYDDVNKKECKKNCDGDKPFYDKDSKICISKCSELEEKTIIDYDKACVSKCNHSYYQYSEEGKCVNQCNETKFIDKTNKKCVDKCEQPYNYIEDRECKKNCENYPFSQEILDENGIGTNLFECVEKCDNDKYYYETGPSYLLKKCFKECQDNSHYIIQDTHICIAVCQSPYKIYISDKTSTSTYQNNTCVLKCPSDKSYDFLGKCTNECSGSYKFHVEGEKECRNICPSGTINDEFTCKSSCPEGKFLDHTEKNCIDSCELDGNYKYYIEGINKCLRDCENGYYKNVSKCVKTCSDNFYLDGNECKESCPDTRSFVNQYENNKCEEKCPSNYPYYEKKDEIKICKINCDYIYPDGECKEQCNETYNFYNYENSSCLQDCPYFYAPNGENQYKCYNKCPNKYPYYNGKKCSEECNNFINLTTNECHENCDNKFFIYEESENKKYCLDKCSDVGAFLLGENKCVKNCSSVDSNLIVNMEKKTCECQQYYYIDENNQINCISKNDLENCPNTEDVEGVCLYKYRLYGTNRYLENCNGYIISVDGKYCYPENFNYPKETTKLEGNQLKCLYKFFKNLRTSSIECLTKDESCPSDYKYLIPETHECVSQCNESDYITSGDYCLNKTICENKIVLFENEYNYKCNNSCPDGYYLIKELKQCVKNCTETEYYIFHNNECILSCDSIPNTIIKKSIKKLAGNSIETFYECTCTSDLWYKKSDATIYCNPNPEIKKCEDLNNTFPFLIKDTRECINECPADYKYKFNKECFHSCEDVSYYYGYNIKTKNDNECDCENLWIEDENNEKICIEGNTCNKLENNNLLVSETRQCVKNCPSGYEIEFNKTCYNVCPSNTEKKGNENTCTCKNKWYINSLEFTICLKENEDCPKDFYPYLIQETKECVPSTDNCISSNNKIFNNTCYENCPVNTKSKGENSCECDETFGKWHKYTNNGKAIFVCGLTECPEDKKFIIHETQECTYSCGDLYIFNNSCYSRCPENTQLVNEISKICEEYINFDNPENIEDLVGKVEQSIKEIYPKAKESKGGIVYNINNSTLQIYGVNKNKKEDQNFIMRTNLTYIDLSNCIDNIYEKSGISGDTDLIIEKYDIGGLTDSSTINPVEYNIRNAQTGELIPLKNFCDDNSIVISYPLSNILNSFSTESNNLRNLGEENKNNLNLREKFLKGKELFLENDKIDSFNFENKIYTDICYPFDINGKDLILEDRFNYLYPLYSFCESNCLYGRTDFVLERVFCNCSPKESVDLDRTVKLLNVNADINKVKDNQKGSVMKCLGKISKISKNFGFFYGLIIMLVEIAMVLLTFLYSYKVFSMRLKKKFDIKGEENNNIDNENVETINLSKAKKETKNTNEDIIKTSERNLENPPKRKKTKKIDKEEDKKEGKFENKNKDEEALDNKKTRNLGKGEIISSTNSYNLFYEKSSVGTVNQTEDDDSIFDSVKLEIRLLRVDYDLALNKNKAEILVMILAEILDKIYIIKAIWFLQKYEIFSLYFSLYLLWHMLIVSFLSLFYNNSTLHKIWIEGNYPTLNFHLSFGFLSCILSFIIYKGMSFLINNDRKIAEIESIAKGNNGDINSKFEKMMFWAKIKMIIFYAVTFILVFIFYLYLIAFCGVYSQTNGLLVESYGIAIIEVIIIKILYGLVLGILRKISLWQKIDKLYLVVRLFDLYVA